MKTLVDIMGRVAIPPVTPLRGARFQPPRATPHAPRAPVDFSIYCGDDTIVTLKGLGAALSSAVLNPAKDGLQ